MAMKTIFNKDFEAIVYVWYSAKTGKMYFGFRKTDDIYDGYVFSSKDGGLIDEWSHGKMERHILFTGTVTEAISFEYWILHWAAANGYRDNLYNIKLGGGVVSIDLSVVTEEMQELGIESIKGNFPEPIEPDVYSVVNHEMVTSVVAGIKSGKYKRVKSSVNTIVKFKPNQVRLNIILEDKVAQISDRMSSFPKKARKEIEPVIVLIDENGRYWIIDGNHTIKAAKRANWSTVDVVYINISDFGFNWSNVDLFGYMMNHDEKVKTPNSKEDCRRAISKLYAQIKLRDDIADIKSGKFKDTCLCVLKGLWTPKTIVANLRSAIRQFENDEANATRNFKVWEKKELDDTVDEIKSKMQDTVVVRISSEKSFNAGFGGVVWKMIEEGLKKGKLIIKHNNIHDYDNWSIAEEKLKGAISAIGSDYNITYEVLEAFEK